MTSIALLGVPHDENSSYLRGPAEAPPLIRSDLFNDAYSTWSETGVDLGAEGRWRDLGDVAFPEGADAWEIITQSVDAALVAGDPLICFGGDHAITHPILRAFARRHAGISILHIDAHPDVYDSFQGNPRSHASPFARIMEQGLARRLVQVGLRSMSDHLRAQISRFGVEAIEARHHERARDLMFEGPVYVSVDLDGLDPSCAPGVSHREPGGLSVRQALDLIHALKVPIVGADIVEYNPRCDLGGMTATVAAKLAKELAGMMVLNGGS